MTSAGQKTADLLNGLLSVADENIKYKSENLFEQAKHIQQLRRVTGYLTGDYKSAFNKGKQQEVILRFKNSQKLENWRK